MLIFEDLMHNHAIYLPVSICHVCVGKIYCLSVSSSVQGSLMHTIACFPLIHHRVSAVHILCVTPS